MGTYDIQDDWGISTGKVKPKWKNIAAVFGTGDLLIPIHFYFLIGQFMMQFKSGSCIIGWK